MTNLQTLILVVSAFIACCCALRNTTKIAFGSCNYHNAPNQTLWRDIVRAEPHIWAWLGDIIYGDTEVNHFKHEAATPKILQEYYRIQKMNPEYQLLVKSDKTRIVGIYDDHDFGLNDAGIDFYMKEDSQRLLLDFLDEPVESPRRSQKGAYASYLIGDEPGKLVKLILLDVRYFQEDPSLPDSDILGREQWKWLAKELKTSEAQVHLIASGIQIMPENKDALLGFVSGGGIKVESWGRFPQSRAKLLQMLTEYNVPGAMFLSGDIHFAEISETNKWKGSYPLYEVTSSGMTHSWGYDFLGFWPGFFAWRPIFDYIVMSVMPAAIRIPGDSYSMFNWGMVSVDWDSNLIILQINGEDGVELEETIDLVTFERHITSPKNASDSVWVNVILQVSAVFAVALLAVQSLETMFSALGLAASSAPNPNKCI